MDAAVVHQELLSFPLLSSPINQIYYFMFIFFLFTSGVFWKSIHFEVASDSFSLLINSSWLLVFAISSLNIGCTILISYHFWCRDLLREYDKKYEVLLIIFFLLFGGVLEKEERLQAVTPVVPPLVSSLLTPSLPVPTDGFPRTRGSYMWNPSVWPVLESG